MGGRLAVIAGQRLAFWGAAFLSLAGCATLSEDQCLTGDWRLIGYQDGTSGAPAGRVGEHGEACARYGVSPNLDVWQIGYREGLTQYCTRSSGFSAGVNGSTYYGVCTGPYEGEFLQAYSDGRQVYDVRQALSQARSDSYSIASDLEDVEDDRDWARQQLDNPDITKEERDRWLDEAERLSERLGDLRRQERDVEFAVRRIQEDAWSVESRMRSFYPEWNGY